MKKIEKQFVKICKKRFPYFVIVADDFLSYCDDDELHISRPKEEIFEFALELIETFGPFPPSSTVLGDEWNRILDKWGSKTPCCQDQYRFEPWTEKEASEWFMKHSEIAGL